MKTEYIANPYAVWDFRRDGSTHHVHDFRQLDAAKSFVKNNDGRYGYGSLRIIDLTQGERAPDVHEKGLATSPDQRLIHKDQHHPECRGKRCDCNLTTAYRSHK